MPGGRRYKGEYESEYKNGTPMLSAERVIELLRLEPLPIEGGHFRRGYLADETVTAAALPPRYGQARPFGSAIYYLLRGDECSALHRLASDEVYHFYLGSPTELLLLRPDGGHEVIALGPDLEAGQRVQVVAPRGTWQGMRLVQPATWALLGTTMAPAYDDGDFEMGARDTLIERYPACAAWIRALTR